MEQVVSKQQQWWYGTCGALLVLLASYSWYATRQYPHGGSLMGVLYGILGLFLLVILMLYGLRKRVYHRRLGSLHTWMTSHICLGVLALAVVLCHSGFRFHDMVAVSTFTLMGIVVGSGILGTYLYCVIPPQLGAVEHAVSIGELAQQLQQLEGTMERLAAGKSAEFRSLYQQLVGALQRCSVSGWRLVAGGKRPVRLNDSVAEDIFAAQTRVATEEQTDLHRLCTLAGQHREIHAQLVRLQRCKNLLEAWLYVHVPFSFALLLAVAIHVVAAFYYSSVGTLVWTPF